MAEQTGAKFSPWSIRLCYAISCFEGGKRERERERQPKAVFPWRSFASGHTQFPFFKGANAGVGRWKLDETKYAADAALISFFSSTERKLPSSIVFPLLFPSSIPNLRVNVRRLCLYISSGLTQLQKSFLQDKIININDFNIDR